jgi:hypothetical protein
MTLNTALRNLLADAFGVVFDSGTLEIQSAASAVLATINLPADSLGASAAGVVSKAGVWSATASGTGTATKAIFKSSAGPGTYQLEVSVATSGGEVTIDNASIIAGGTVTVTAFTWTQPAS